MTMENIVDMRDRDRLTRLADLIFEAGMLRKTPRTGYQFWAAAPKMWPSTAFARP
jgi:putative hydrolase of HD superfamily